MAHITMLNELLLLVLIGATGGLQSEGGYISQADIQITHTIYTNSPEANILRIGNEVYIITIEIPQHAINPFVVDNFLYFEVV